MIERSIHRDRMSRVLLFLVSLDDLFRDFSSLEPVRLFRRAHHIFLLSSIIHPRMPEWGSASLVDAQSTTQMLDGLLAVLRLFRQSNTLDPVSNCV